MHIRAIQNSTQASSGYGNFIPAPGSVVPAALGNPSSHSLIELGRLGDSGVTGVTHFCAFRHMLRVTMSDCIVNSFFRP